MQQNPAPIFVQLLHHDEWSLGHRRSKFQSELRHSFHNHSIILHQLLHLRVSRCHRHKTFDHIHYKLHMYVSLLPEQLSVHPKLPLLLLFHNAQLRHGEPSYVHAVQVLLAEKLQYHSFEYSELVLKLMLKTDLNQKKM